ncbi:transglycosylase SLT domain-containing protein [Thiohalocapsa marina]|uniref:Transglycosylase SLT domain-containing protein n=1 Tax=Thiohalocapsa marina TaxID=424902 RepID=A0A5M8FR31_9GAMM|nr:lytic transglycosylase domain-containing protein [Thiohalocapsa marina]KAA6183582.1 transglycosylase SLT domain-containing protein [Thiohalocapsa marina]
MPAAASTPQPTTDARADFLAAEQALADGDHARFDTLLAGLTEHPLLPYLQLSDLLARLDRAAEAEAGAEFGAEVEAFLSRWQGTAPGERLRLQWLKRLAREGRWQGYIDAYVDNGSETRACLYRRALLATGRAEAAFDGLDALYLTGKDLPTACDPLFAAWSAAGKLAPELVWQRIQLTLERDNVGTARFQQRYLPAAQRPWLDSLLLVHAQPQQIAALSLPDAAEQRAAILAHGIERLARQDPALAIAVSQPWLDTASTSTPRPTQVAADPPPNRIQIPPQAQERVHLAIGVALANADDPAALRYLQRLHPRPDNLDRQLRRLRAALRLEAWPELAAWVAQLPPDADDEGEWHYWRGRALSELGDTAAADQAFERAASARSLWGFLAAERVGHAPAIAHRPAPVDPALLDALLASPTAARIAELQRLGRDADVAREWRELTRPMTTQALITAAAFADRLGLVTESIFTLARAGYWDDMDLRFPLPQQRLVEVVARQQGLPPDWLHAVMRQESAFDADIASPAGAVGLMQLMPATAREMARNAGLAAPSHQDLTDPVLNVALGARYLAAMRARFGGNTLLATAAYNAGPNAVRRWLPSEPMAADLWLTRIPYRETRDYVRRVLTYRVIYAHRLGQTDFSLDALLSPVACLETERFCYADES